MRTLRRRQVSSGFTFRVNLTDGEFGQLKGKDVTPSDTWASASSAGTPGQMQDEMVYRDRETAIAHQCFEKRDSVPFLDIVNPGSKQRDLFRKIENLAWDMTWPRYAEWFIARNVEGDHLLLYYLTFDQKLGRLLSCYEVKAAVVDRERGFLIPIAARTVI